MNRLFLFLFLFISARAAAQSFTLIPIPAEVEAPASEQPMIAFADLTNQTDSSQTVRWQRIVEDIPDGWASHICTPLGCIPEDISEGEFPMLPLEALNVDVQFDTYGIPGEGTVEVKLFFESDSTEVVIGRYFGTANGTSAVEETQQMPISIYPNPCMSNVYIRSDANIASVIIRDVFGNKCSQQTYTSDGIDTAGLVPSLYFISVFDESGESIADLPFVKAE